MTHQFAATLGIASSICGFRLSENPFSADSPYRAAWAQGHMGNAGDAGHAEALVRTSRKAGGFEAVQRRLVRAA